MNAFAEATGVVALGDGAYLSTCDAGWSTQLGPNGVLLAHSRQLALLVES